MTVGSKSSAGFGIKTPCAGCSKSLCTNREFSCSVKCLQPVWPAACRAGDKRYQALLTLCPKLDPTDFDGTNQAACEPQEGKPTSVSAVSHVGAVLEHF